MISAFRQKATLDVTTPAETTPSPRPGRRVPILIIATLLFSAAVVSPHAAAQEISGDLIVFLDIPAASSTPAAGAIISVADVTRNISATPAGASTTALYLSASSAFDASAIFLGSRAVPPLGPGETNAGLIAFALPPDHAGLRFIFARADNNNEITEGNEGNNVSAPKSIAIGADLIVSIDVPGTVGTTLPGGTVVVTDLTRSDNSAPAGPSTTRFYLIPGSTFEPATAIHVGSRAIPALGPSTTNVGEAVLTIPPHAAGTFRIVARADADGAVLEANEANNVSNVSAPFAIGPDLVVSVDLPGAFATVAAGATIQVTDVTRNRGRASVGNSTTRFYLSADTGLDGSDIPLGDRPVPDLAASAESTAATSLAIPAGIAGRFRVIARADADNARSESNEGNNTAASGIMSVGPDLRISGITVPARAAAGTTVFVSDRTRNGGAGTAPVSRTDYYLSRDAVLDGGDLLLGSRVIPALNASDANADTTTVDIPRATGEGPHFIIVVADGGHAVAESDEDNNTALRQIEILPDLTGAVPRDHLLPDFDGDGKADLVWREPSGSVELWLMDGPRVLHVRSYRIAWDWSIQGFGDFNRDGKTDILWRHESGLVEVWIMDGTLVAHTGPRYSIDWGWTIQGVGDFDGDGQADILWRHASGLVDMWLMDGPFIAGANAQQYSIDWGWTIQGVGDFDGDGQADILWRHESGLVDMWLMDGPFIASAGVRQHSIDWGWTIQGVGDFNGDGRADILWRHASGLVDTWLMDGPLIASAGVQYQIGPEWAVQAVGDLNGDGQADVLWRHDSGLMDMWLMDGPFIATAGLQFPVDPALILQ